MPAGWLGLGCSCSDSLSSLSLLPSFRVSFSIVGTSTDSRVRMQPATPLQTTTRILIKNREKKNIRERERERERLHACLYLCVYRLCVCVCIYYTRETIPRRYILWPIRKIEKPNKKKREREKEEEKTTSPSQRALPSQLVSFFFLFFFFRFRIISIFDLFDSLTYFYCVFTLFFFSGFVVFLSFGQCPTFSGNFFFL